MKIDPEDIPDDDHELVIEQSMCDRRGQSLGQGVRSDTGSGRPVGGPARSGRCRRPGGGERVGRGVARGAGRSGDGRVHLGLLADLVVFARSRGLGVQLVKPAM